MTLNELSVVLNNWYEQGEDWNGFSPNKTETCMLLPCPSEQVIERALIWFGKLPKPDRIIRLAAGGVGMVFNCPRYDIDIEFMGDKIVYPKPMIRMLVVNLSDGYTQAFNESEIDSVFDKYYYAP